MKNLLLNGGSHSVIMKMYIVVEVGCHKQVNKKISYGDRQVIIECLDVDVFLSQTYDHVSVSQVEKKYRSNLLIFPCTIHVSLYKLAYPWIQIRPRFSDACPDKAYEVLFASINFVLVRTPILLTDRSLMGSISTEVGLVINRDSLCFSDQKRNESYLIIRSQKC
jgi:hypothetical protein